MSTRVTVEEKRDSYSRWTPSHAVPSDWRWWVVVGVTAAIALGIAWIAGLVIGFYVSMESDVSPLWYTAVVYAPFAVAALASAAIGGVRRWWLVVPAAIVFVLLLLEPGELGGDAYMRLGWAGIAWSLTVGSTALIRWFGRGSR